MYLSIFTDFFIVKFKEFQYLIIKMRENWSTLDEKIKAAYGSRYVQDYETVITNAYKTRPRIQVWVQYVA